MLSCVSTLVSFFRTCPELITHSRKPGSNPFNCLIDIRVKSASGSLLDSSYPSRRLAGSKGRQESEHRSALASERRFSVRRRMNFVSEEEGGSAPNKTLQISNSGK
jgi:hypothetical protein